MRLSKIALILSLFSVAEGCRRRAKPAEGSSVVDGVAAETAGVGNEANPTASLISPAPPITNSVAPQPRVDAKTGKLILQTDGPLLKKKTSAE